MSTDQQLISNYLSGDEEALKELISRYLKPVYNFIYHLAGNKENAEDISQETFVKAWKNLKKYNPEQNFKTWLFTIARNTAIDWLRKKKSLVFSDFDSDDKNVMESTLSDESPQALEEIILSEDKKHLLEGIEKLSPMYQSILTLRYNEEFTFKEIGEILGKPLHTVKSQHRRALIQL